MKLYKSYMFRTKDPAIDEFRTVVQDAHGGALNSKILNQMEKDGGPSITCMKGWFFGKTNRPQNCTLEAAGRSLGFRRKWVPLRNGRTKR